MAKNPKVKDPTEVALSAIQEALNISDTSGNESQAAEPGHRDTLRAPAEDFGEVRAPRGAANDDREAIGAILQAIQNGRPRRSAYLVAAIFSTLWIAAAALLGFAFLPTLETMVGSNGGALALVGLACAFIAPLVLFYFMASIAWRGQDLSLIAQSMAQMAVRFSEPEHVANDAIVTVGQAIRREVAAMGDGVERAIARAGELEILVTNEVAALERAYSDNEVRIRALLQDISVQRDNLVGQAEQVRNAISGVQIDLRQDIALISDAIAARVDEVALNITQTLEDRSEHITSALSASGDSMIVALGERGGDLLDRLEEASSQTSQAIQEASERLSTSLDFKTGHVHEEFADLAERVHEMLNERIERITAAFAQKSTEIIDGIVDRTETVHDSLKNSGDSLLSEMDLRAADLVTRIDEVGSRLADHMLTSGEKASEAMDVTVNSLVEKVVSQTETSHETLTAQISAFEGLIREQGTELAEKFARDSGTLGALITRHVAEFDRTVKTFGGEIVERMGQHTQNIADNLKTYVDTFDGRVTAYGEQIHSGVDQRLAAFQSAIDSRVTSLDVTLDTKIKTFDETIEGHLKSLGQSFEGRAAAVTDLIDSRSTALNNTIETRFMEMQKGIETHAGSVATDIEARVSRFENLLDIRVDAAASRLEASSQRASETLLTRTDELTQGIKTRVEDSERMLTTLVSETTDVIQSGARTAQQSLLSLSGEVGAHLRSIATDVERGLQNSARETETALILASNNAAAQIKSNAAEIERTIAASTESFGNALGGKVDEITGGVQQQTDRLVRIIDEKRSPLVDAISGTGERLVAALDDKSSYLVTVFAEKGELLSSALSEKSTELANTLSAQSDHLINALDGRGNQLVVALTDKSAQMVSTINDKSTQAVSALSNKSAEMVAALSEQSAQAVSALSDKSAEMVITLNDKSTQAVSALNDTSSEMVAALNDKSTHAVSALRDKSVELVGTLGAQSDAFINALDGRSNQFIIALNDKSTQVVAALGDKGNELVSVINGATQNALKAIETQSGDFTIAMMNNSSHIAHQITTASETATSALNKSLKDVEQTTHAAIEQSRQVASAAVTEMQETSKILRTDTVALFERLREGNILLQEVLTGAHDNLNSLERALVTRVADFVSTLNDVTTRNGASTTALEEQLKLFTDTTKGALDGLTTLSGQFETHGRVLSDAVKLVDESNERADQTVTQRNALLESLITTLDTRTVDLDDRLRRFTSLLDESLDAAEARARDIARVVAESASTSSSAVGRQFEAVRIAVEDERRQTLEAMAEIYDQGTQEAGSMFQQAADKFAGIVQSMKQMASELHHELDATRADLRRGVLEMPQEAAESTAQMRKVIVDQIEALAELNRIVARHGRGLDVASNTRTTQRDEEVAMAVAGARVETARPAPRSRDASASSLPPPDIGMTGPRRAEAPPVSPADSDQSRDGWLSDLLNRADTDTDPRLRQPQPRAAGNPLEALSLDINRLLDRELAAEMWDRYQRGERKAFSKRLYTPAGQKAFDEVTRKYRSDRGFKQTVDRYINEFERLLDDVSRDERGPALLRNHLISETGLVYTLLAHAAGRLG